MSFKESLKFGNTLEKEVCDLLKAKDVDCYNTKQEPDAEDRKIYKTIDVVVRKDNKVLMGIECKIQNEYYRNCQKNFGYDGKFNVVLNMEALERYKKADFPTIILFRNDLVGKYYYITVEEIIKIRPNVQLKDAGYRKTDIKYNYNCFNWKSVDKLEDLIDKIKVAV